MRDDTENHSTETIATRDGAGGEKAPEFGKNNQEYLAVGPADVSDFGAPKASFVPKFGYMLDSFVPAPGEDGTFSFALAAYRSETLARKWRRVFLADAVSGRPGSYVQLWRVPFADLEREKALANDQPPYHRAFVKKTTSFTRTRLGAMVYDPAEGSAGPGALIDQSSSSLLVNEVNVRKGAMARFADLKQRFFIGAVSEARFGWRLIAAGVTGVGDDRRVFQIWKLPTLDALPFTMRRIGQNATYREGLAPCIAEEDQQLFEVLDWG